MKKFLTLFLASTCILSTTACGGGANNSSTNGGGNAEVQDLTIIMSSTEISAKNDDAYVKEIIQNKFYEDRGIKINLDVQVYAENDFNDVISNRMASGKWDAAIGYLGQAGIDEIVISQNVCMELSQMVPLYDNLYNLVKDELTATTTIDGSVWGIPSV